VRSKLVALLNSSKDLTDLDYLKPEYGRHSALGYVKVYENSSAMKVECEHKVKRNFEVKMSPEGGQKQEAPAAEAPKEEKAEKPKGEKKEKPEEEKKGEK
jgi:ribosomal protein S24E